MLTQTPLFLPPSLTLTLALSPRTHLFRPSLCTNTLSSSKPSPLPPTVLSLPVPVLLSRPVSSPSSLPVTSRSLSFSPLLFPIMAWLPLQVRFEFDIDRNSDLAANLKGHLMLTTGDIDNNVRTSTCRAVTMLSP